MSYAKAAFALLALTGSLIAADPAVGTWNLNVAKSRYSPGPAPKSATVTYEETADGIRRTGETIEADGSRTNTFEYVAKYDGKDHPVKGSDQFDTISVRSVGNRTVAATLKKSGKVVRQARRVVSADGQTLTITVTGMNEKGQKVRNVSVYKKQ